MSETNPGFTLPVPGYQTRLSMPRTVRRFNIVGRMQHNLWKTLSLLVVTFWVAACTSPPVTPAPSPLPTDIPAQLDLQSSIQRAVAYLQNEYNPDIGLIRESPDTAPDVYWLATDNWLAALALSPYDPELADDLMTAINEYSGVEHGLIEALDGKAIVWPPHVAQPEESDTEGVKVERRDGDEVFSDWAEYSDLVLYEALNAYNQGYTEEAQKLYQQVLKKFNGMGFADKAWEADDNHYATYKLALALYVGALIGEPPDQTILSALLSKQHDSGGFKALYDTNGKPVNDTNTETTAYALLALGQLAGVP